MNIVVGCLGIVIYLFLDYMKRFAIADFTFSHQCQKCTRMAARIRVCNSVKFETSLNLLQVLKIAIHTAQLCADIRHCC